MTDWWLHTCWPVQQIDDLMLIPNWMVTDECLLPTLNLLMIVIKPSTIMSRTSTHPWPTPERTRSYHRLQPATDQRFDYCWSSSNNNHHQMTISPIGWQPMIIEPQVVSHHMLTSDYSINQTTIVTQMVEVIIIIVFFEHFLINQTIKMWNIVVLNH